MKKIIFYPKLLLSSILHQYSIQNSWAVPPSVKKNVIGFLFFIYLFIYLFKEEMGYILKTPAKNLPGLLKKK